jgi:predicted nucleic acid-binding protein
MKPMPARYFIDTNVLLYAVSKDKAKKKRALSLVKGRGTISGQVICESVNVLFRKLNFTYAEIQPIIDKFATRLEIYLVQFETIQTAIQIAERYQFSSRQPDYRPRT